MSSNQYSKYKFDEDGFLTNLSSWDKTLAQNIAYIEGIGLLSKKHFEVIKHLREHYFKTGSVTAARIICHESHLGRYCINELFSNHGVEACRKDK